MRKGFKVSILFLFIAVGITSFDQVNFKPGAICIVENGDGRFGVVKVLVVDNKYYHVKMYKNVYDTKPKKIDKTKLTIGSMYDKDGFGFGHTPLDKPLFYSWKPLQIDFEKVGKEELEGYELWRTQ